MNKELTRRQFLTAATALAVTGTRQIRVLGASSRKTCLLRLPETIRVGIIGLDGHYSEITNAAKLVPNIRITAIADPNPAALQRAAADPMLAKATAWTDYHKMLGAEKLDIVAVCGQNGTAGDNSSSVRRTRPSHRRRKTAGTQLVRT